jgi:hypothetical protein
LIYQLPNRTSKQIRERYRLYLDPNVKHSPFSIEEDIILINLVSKLGKKWSQIALVMAGRTDVQLKYRFKIIDHRNRIFIPQPRNDYYTNVFQFSQSIDLKFTKQNDPAIKQNIFQIEESIQDEFLNKEHILISTQNNLFNIGIPDDDFGREIFEDSVYHSDFDFDSFLKND